MAVTVGRSRIVGSLTAMARRARISFLALLLASTGFATAQDRDAEITVLSVLTMAKDEAEKAPNEPARIGLRQHVANSIARTGQEVAFGSYVADARRAYRQDEAQRAGQNEVARFNAEILSKAERAFHAGDIEKVRDTLAQCRGHWPPPRCAPGEWEFGSNWVESLFLGWEIDAGKLAAAFERIKSAPWWPPTRAVILVAAGPYAAAGDRAKLNELMRLAEEDGSKFDSCILKEIPSDTTRGSKPLEKAAAIRKLACDGQASSSLEMALSEKDGNFRTGALAIVAEGLAGIPGVYFEKLLPF